MLYLQSWQTSFVVIITIASVSFFTYVGASGAEAALNWTLVSFVVLLPLALLLFLVSQIEVQGDLESTMLYCRSALVELLSNIPTRI